MTYFTLATSGQSSYTQSELPSDIRTGNSCVVRKLKHFALPCAGALYVALSAVAAGAEPAPASASTTIELNKLESADKGCRAYVVVNNGTDTTYQSFKIDLVLFQTDGVIGRRFSIELAPLRPKKKSVKLFEIDGITCDKIGSLLINDVMECKADTGPVPNCLDSLKTSTLTNVQLSK